MNDHIKSEISSYLAGDLPESRNRQIEAHAASCEKCRGAISKARAKQARIKREALKKASTDDIPNFFLARQRKLSGVDAASGGKSWIVVAILVIASGAYWVYQKKNAPNHHPAVTPAPAPTPASSPTPPPRPPPAPAEKPPEPSKPPVVLHVLQNWQGPDCGVTEHRVVVVRNKEAWQKLWAGMALKDPLPEVDFDQKLVMGIFAGGVPIGTSVLLGRIEEADDEVTAPYRITIPTAPPAVQASSHTALAVAPAASHPYLLAVISRVNKRIRLTQKENPS